MPRPKLLFLATLAAGLLTGIPTSSAAVSTPTLTEVAGQQVRVQTYTHRSQDERDFVRYKVADLVRRAIDYRRTTPGSKVEIRLAAHELSHELHVGRRYTECSLGVYDHDACGIDTERLVWLLVKAAKHRVHVELVYQNPEDNARQDVAVRAGQPLVYDALEDDAVSKFFDAYASDRVPGTEGKTVADFLRYERVYWADGDANGKQNNNFVLVNVYRGARADMRHSVYVSTADLANADDGLAETGVLVDGNAGLYRAYRSYFSKLWKFNVVSDEFHAALQDGASLADPDWAGHSRSHRSGNLNYDDGQFKAYFFPMPVRSCWAGGKKTEAWDTENNPVAGLTERMHAQTKQDRSLRIDIHRFELDTFGRRLRDELEWIPTLSADVQVRATINELATRGRERPTFDGVQSALSTHARSYAFAFGANEYHSVTGSADAQWSAYCAQANNQLVISESSPVTHDALVEASRP